MNIVIKNQLNVLIQLAQVDNHFAPEEFDVILRIAKAHNFTEQMVDDLIRNPNPIPSLGALSNDQRFYYLMTCIELTRADSKILDSEITFCRGIAIKLGFKKDVVDYLLEHIDSVSKETIKINVFSDFETN